MPRLPGRESTQKQINVQHAWIASFNLPWETQFAKRRCCIDDCDHIVGGECGESPGPASIVTDDLTFVGFACPHCVDRILGRE